MAIGRLKFVLVVFFIGGCVEPFTPELPSDKTGALVVEGYINAGAGESIFKLTRTVPFNDTDQSIDYETHATVQIVDDQDHRFALTEIEHRLYSTGQLTLPLTAAYRLDITLHNGTKYQSEFLPVKVTPPIDSISWEWSDQLYLYVNTHDLSGATRFYQWTFHEDWQIQSPLESLLKWEEDTIKIPTPSEKKLMFNCWKSSKSEGLHFTSTKALQTDNVKFNLIRFPQGAEKTSVKYSIIVKQNALTEEHYNYLRLMQRNTTLTGSFFDPLPSHLYGNIKNLADTEEIVVGYVGVYTTEKSTRFINNGELPFVARGNTCATEQFAQNDQMKLNQYLRSTNLYVPYKIWIDLEGNPWLLVIERPCVDCRVYGSSIKPAYWD
jgi:hypothetical protein